MALPTAGESLLQGLENKKMLPRQTSQSDGGDFSVEGLFSQVTLVS